MGEEGCTDAFEGNRLRKKGRWFGRGGLGSLKKGEEEALLEGKTRELEFLVLGM